MVGAAVMVDAETRSETNAAAATALHAVASFAKKASDGTGASTTRTAVVEHALALRDTAAATAVTRTAGGVPAPTLLAVGLRATGRTTLLSSTYPGGTEPTFPTCS